MLYIFDEINLIDDELYKSMISLLSEERISKIKRLGTPLKQKASAMAYLLLRIALFKDFGIDEAVIFKFADNGKPLLNDFSHLYFNLSHSKDAAACAVSEVEVGVDVQIIKPITDKLAKRVLTPHEYASFKESPDPEDYFFRIWVIKESFIKKTGHGLAAELRAIEADEIKNITIFKNKDYYYSLCGPEMQVKHIRREDIEHFCNR